MANFPEYQVMVYIGVDRWGVSPGVSFTTKPAASKLTSNDIKTNGGNAVFTPDVGGIYAINGLPVEVATLLKRKVDANGPNYRTYGTVFVFVFEGVVVASAVSYAGQITPRIDSDSQMGKLAAQDSGVIAALAAFVGKTSAQIASTHWPALVSAWESACTNPSTPPGEDAATVDLMSDGWEKA